MIWPWRKRVEQPPIVDVVDELHPPQGVAVVDADGILYPVDVRYVATDAGVQTYEIVGLDRLPHGVRPVRFHIDVMPGLTSLLLPVARADVGER